MTLRIYAIAYLVFLYAPIALLPLFAFNDATIIAFPLSGFTTNWFAELMTTQALHRAVQNSLFIAVITALLSTILGICAARAGAMYAFPFKRSILGLVMIPLVARTPRCQSISGGCYGSRRHCLLLWRLARYWWRCRLFF